MNTETQSKLQSVIDAIYELENEDLDAVFEAAKNRRGEFAIRKASTLRVGQTVKFDRGPRRGGTCTGTVRKINKKTVKVLVGNTTWRVAPTFLTVV